MLRVFMDKITRQNSEERPHTSSQWSHSLYWFTTLTTMVCFKSPFGLLLSDNGMKCGKISDGTRSNSVLSYWLYSISHNLCVLTFLVSFIDIGLTVLLTTSLSNRICKPTYLLLSFENKDNLEKYSGTVTPLCLGICTIGSICGCVLLRSVSN